MIDAGKNLRNATAPQRGPRRTRSTEDLWLHLLLFACGALPWLGYTRHGAWNQTELAVGMLLMGPAIAKSMRALRARAHGRGAGKPPPERHGGSHGRSISRTDPRLFHSQLGLHQALRTHLKET